MAKERLDFSDPNCEEEQIETGPTRSERKQSIMDFHCQAPLHRDDEKLYVLLTLEVARLVLLVAREGDRWWLVGSKGI